MWKGNMEELTAKWYNETKTIVWITYPKTFTLAHLRDWVNATLIHFFDEVDHPVVMLTNSNHTIAPPDLLVSLPDLKREMLFLRHPNYAGQVFYNVSAGVDRVSVEMWSKIFDRMTLRAVSLDDALEKATMLLSQAS